MDAADRPSWDDLLKLLEIPEAIATLEQGSRPLMIAAIVEKRADVVARLLELGLAPDLRDELGFSLLEHAVRADALAVASALLDHGADPAQAGPVGETPLHAAARADNLALAVLLLERGAPLVTPGAPYSPLEAAASTNAAAVTEALLERGAPLEDAVSIALRQDAVDAIEPLVRRLSSSAKKRLRGEHKRAKKRLSRAMNAKLKALL